MPRFGPFAVDAQRLLLLRDGQKTSLNPQAVRLLILLMERRMEVVTRDDIRSHLWPDEVEGDFGHRINAVITQIRHALDDRPERPIWVQTLVNQGYRFIGQIESGPVVPENKLPSPDLAASVVAAHASSASHLGRRHFVLGLAAGGIAGFSIAVIRPWLVPRPAHVAVQPLTLQARPRTASTVPLITSVSPIHATKTQDIIISGRGFGHFTRFSALDSPFLAICNDTAHWAGGRIQPDNADQVTVSIGVWTDSHIVIEGFAGDYGLRNWKLHVGDKIRLRVWNPQAPLAPDGGYSEYRTTVVP